MWLLWNWVLLLTTVTVRAALLGNAKCNDVKLSCPDNTTCCLMATKEYGCCPMPSAVCCSDGLHCCPSNSKCDQTLGTCIKQDTVLRFFGKDEDSDVKVSQAIKMEPLHPHDNIIVFLSDFQKNSVPMEKFRSQPTTCPDGKSECPSGTCCMLRSGQYGCCDLQDAVCCDDGVHCCPQDFTCDVEHRSCKSVKLGVSISWVDKKPSIAHPVSVQAEKYCADNKTLCEQNDTCCNITKGFGCCPLSNAVCCLDGMHCCPFGTHCDVPNRRCYKSDTNWEQPWVDRPPLNSSYPLILSIETDKEPQNGKPSLVLNEGPSNIVGVEKISAVICPDGQMCADGQTCCQLSDGSYGCCSYSDNLDVNSVSKIIISGSCKNRTSVICPGGKAECCDGETCCMLESGNWGCCPQPQAVCCSDHIHCCPEGFRCDIPARACKKAEEGIPWSEKQHAVHRLLVQNVVCPDQTSACPDGNTCCLMSSGSYGCCPLPKAVCCSDGVHCCPSGTTCDVTEGKCLKGEISTPWLEKRPAIQSLSVQNVVCPDQTSACPDGNTCCLMSSGTYGCCPLPEAVCCSDGIHCCPSGTTCDVAEGKCLKGEISTPWLEKHPAGQRLTVQDVVCPDQTSECPDGNTCCLMSSGSYGCCPLPKAVCCSDEIHCCPFGTTCDVAEGKCLKGEISTTWLEKHPAVQRLRVQDVVCPDQTSECPDGNTCCLMSSGSYGCCPLPKAVCCSDEVHCCPSGTTCDVAEGKCLKGEISTPWLEKHPSVQRLSVQTVVCPDQTSECPDGNTCCLMSSGSYGCCPLPKAVCCSDEVHCCPSGTTCDVAEGKCLKGEISTPWLEKQPAVQRLLVQGLMCDDGKTECPNGNTCCNVSSGGYGCCPLPEAVCCNDKLHCCPNGYTCDDAEGSCRRGEISTPWLEKQPAIQSKRLVQDIVCPDETFVCPDDNTCCLLQSGDYGCCPLPKAVCCDDKIHCCPNGTTCNTAERKCQQGNISLPWQEKQPAQQKYMMKTRNIICPDQQSECPDGNTCCKMQSGQYGCCPQPEAVCCSDGLHCCSKGYQCDTKSGQCFKEQHAIAWQEKLPPLQRDLVGTVYCPDWSQCADGNTCCKMSSGDYGCCPLPSAVCCDDGAHCCPADYTCVTASGQCTKDQQTISWVAKQNALPRFVNIIICPDKQSECQDGQTCCSLSSGGYGCCPLPKAVCCPDHLHCCPENYICNTASGSCTLNESTLNVPWIKKLPAMTLH